MEVSATEHKQGADTSGPPINLPHIHSDYHLFASHPVEVDFRAWSTTTTYGNITTDIFALFLSTIASTPLGNKLKNLRFYNGNLKIKVVVQGSPYAQGKLVYSFDPFNIPVQDTYGLRIQPPQKVRSMLLPHIEIDPSKNASYELELPPTSQWGVYHILGHNYGSWSWNFIAVNPLGSGTTTEPSIGITTYLSIDDKHLSTLTFTSVSSKEEGKYSSYFTKAANMSQSVASVAPPRLASGLTLFSLVSNTVSSFLQFFGFGKHVIQDVNYVHLFNTANNQTLVDSKIDSTVLGLRATNSLSLSPLDCPLLSQEDQLLSNLMRRKSLVHQHYLATSAAAGSLLITVPVVPHLCFALDSPAISNNYEPSTLAFCAAPYLYWRGDIDVTLEAVCSVFHRATILAAYFPNTADTAVTYANAVQTVKTWVIQISGNSVTEFTIPWSQPEEFLSCPTALGTTTSLSGNGVLTLYLVNAVTTNGSTDPVYINFYYSSKNMSFGHLNNTFTTNYGIFLSSAMAPTNIVSGETATDSLFFKRFFGEGHAVSVKELTNRMEYIAMTHDYLTHFTNTTLYWKYPAIGINDSTQLPVSGDANYLSLGTFPWVSYAYMGRRGSMNFTWFPSPAIDSGYVLSAAITRAIPTNFQAYTSSSVDMFDISDDCFATYNPLIQNGMTVSVPYYYHGHFYPNYPPQTSGEPVVFRMEIATDNTINGALFQSSGDDFNWVFFRGIPVLGL
jgi:hypothetical protein